MAVPAQLLAAIHADLGRSRQEELPLSNEEKRRPSFQPPPEDLSKTYDPQIKQALESSWSISTIAAIVDAESEQMAGLTNLNARPWASSGQIQASQFTIPESRQTAAPRQPALPAPAASPSTSVAPGTPTRDPWRWGGKCEVSWNDTVVTNAEFCVEARDSKNGGLLILRALGQAELRLSVLDFEVPVIYGTSCIIKMRSVAGAAAQLRVYAVKPAPPTTAEKLVQILDRLQAAVCKASGIERPKPPTTPSTPRVDKVTTAPESIICADSPESSPEPSPRLRQIQLIEVSAPKKTSTAPISLDEIFDSINKFAQNAYNQNTGYAVPISPAASATEQPSDVAMAEWLNKGCVDSEVDKTKRVLLEILRFMRQLQIKDQTREAFRAIDRGVKSQGRGIFYSAPEILGLKKAAVVPAAMTAKKGLSGSLWAKK
ncbi:hypothetical protein A9K55_002108 [Cordyceps militaris]|uniref:Uncharacterized protein n=1 Tax=Cordyceps militaris TaxID=73501 RepID=A0A2H4SST4_CORMI|nr:hypothetical protein A9K55_002108 [Cordyceps militaris]